MKETFTKTAVSIPKHIYRRAEARRHTLGVSRSAFFARALSEALDRHKQDVERYLSGYLLNPETEEEESAVLASLVFAALNEDERDEAR